MYLKQNFKLLRKRMGRSQHEVSGLLSITRSAYNSYENGVAEPPISLLIKIADFYRINLDKLVRIDLTDIAEFKLIEMESGYDVDIKGTQLRVIATTVNQNDKENIELVPVTAKAGYTSGYADPSYISVLPAFNMPFLSENKKYRVFPISGDSMPPVVDKAFVTGEYVQDWNMVDNGLPYIIVTKEDGIVFKVLYNQIKAHGCLLLCSTNALYEPYTVPIADIIEVWKFVNYINPKFEEPKTIEKEDVGITLRNLQKDVKLLHQKVDTINR